MADDTGNNESTNPLATASADNLIALGALLVVGSWLIFEVIAEEYFVTTAAVGLALLILIVPRLDMDAIKAIAPAPAFLRIAAYFLAFIGVVELVDEVRSGVLDNGGATIVGALVAYAGYVLAFLGARRTQA